jgi:hypothetical protein
MAKGVQAKVRHVPVTRARTVRAARRARPAAAADGVEALGRWLEERSR